VDEIAYELEWDANKAAGNLAKHGVDFAQAAEVFADPLALTVFDEAHSMNEERWLTLGLTRSGRLLVVSHTFDQTTATQARVRIISAREAKGRERRDYEQAPR
jgi:uncharacterized DUF497 family protein